MLKVNFKWRLRDRPRHTEKEATGETVSNVTRWRHVLKEKTLRNTETFKRKMLIERRTVIFPSMLKLEKIRRKPEIRGRFKNASSVSQRK